MKMKQRTHLIHNGDDSLTNNMGKKNDMDSHSEIQLYKIKPQDHFIEAQVQKGDTLQAIALRFYCSISELKRINHIHKDNEIFARRTIKVPVTPYSVLTELVPVNQPDPTPSTSAHTSNSALQELLHGSINDVPENSNNTSQREEDSSIDCNAVVMNTTLTPSIVPYRDTEAIEEEITEDSQLLPNKEKVCVEAVVVKQLTAQGADLGLKWFHLVSFVLLLGVVIPLVYVIFYLDKSPHALLSASDNDNTSTATHIIPEEHLEENIAT